MKVILPMAGRGQRYRNEGYSTPKPLIEVNGKPMVLHALQSLREVPFTQLIVVCLEETEAAHHVSGMLQPLFGSKLRLVTIPAVTEGQLCTVLEAKRFLAPADEVLIMASDTYIVSGIGKDIAEKNMQCAGLISVAGLPGEQWSFARTDANGKVIEVAEKKRISEHASTGLYYFTQAADLLHYGEEMIRNNERTRGEFYVMPVYQKMIDAGKDIRLSEASEMWDLGTPESKSVFEAYLNGK